MGLIFTHFRGKKAVKVLFLFTKILFVNTFFNQFKKTITSYNLMSINSLKIIFI